MKDDDKDVNYYISKGYMKTVEPDTFNKHIDSIEAEQNIPRVEDKTMDLRKHFETAAYMLLGIMMWGLAAGLGAFILQKSIKYISWCWNL